jgi:hypothetical protein
MKSLSEIKEYLIGKIKMGDPFEIFLNMLYILSLLGANIFLTEEQYHKFVPYFVMVGLLLVVIYYERLRRAKEKISQQNLKIEHQQKLVEEKTNIATFLLIITHSG